MVILRLLMGGIVRLTALLVISYWLLVAAPKAFADTSCQPIYGGGQSCITTNNILVNKTILNPQTNQFVDNLSINYPKYNPGFIPTFQISVTNTGNANVSRIGIKDILPQYISFGSGAGIFDPNSNTLSFSITDLAPNETRKYTVVGRVINAEQIPIASGSVVCVINQAIAMINDNSVSQDNAQFCIQKTSPSVAVTTGTKGGFPVFSSVPITSTPKTGPEALALFALVLAGLSGWFMIKYAGKKEEIK